ncbi:hypothetical protein FRC11_002876, partial [Ceratobasidium sp. 423]
MRKGTLYRHRLSVSMWEIRRIHQGSRVPGKSTQLDTAQEIAPPLSPPTSTRSIFHLICFLGPLPPNIPTPTHESSESSVAYFIGDLLHSRYGNNAQEKWTGDGFVIDSEHERVRVCMYGEKTDVPLTGDVTRQMKDAMGWNEWKSAETDASHGLRDAMPLAMPRISGGGL